MEKPYAGTGNTRGNGISKQFFEYDPVTDKWTAKADFPELRRWASAYAVGDKGYAGFGRYDVIVYRDWWQYDPATDTWTRKADFPGAFGPDAGYGFALNNKIYIGGTASLDPLSTNGGSMILQLSWTQKKNMPWGYDILKGVVINNKGYLMGYENWQYDDVADSWTQKAFFLGQGCLDLFSP